MERELFDWSGWDGEPECMIFYDVVLKVKLGEFDVGTKFATAAIIQGERGNMLEFYKDDEQGNKGIPCACFRLHYRVGERLS